MALENPGLVQASDALFGAIKPMVNDLRKLGCTDFTDGMPNLDIKPGATLKVRVSSVAAASEYNEETNNYTTGGDTAWASLTATHFLQGFDLKGADVDNGAVGIVSSIKQNFSMRASCGISLAMSGVLGTALDGVTTSTGITLPANPTIDEYNGLLGQITGKNKVNALGSILVLSGVELGKIKAAFFNKGINPGSLAELAALLNFRDAVLATGVNGRLWVAPPLSLGFIARVPTIIADYESAGIETDPETGLSIGIVVANVQATNKKIVNADLWLGASTLSANAAATEAGIIKVGTASAG